VWTPKRVLLLVSGFVLLLAAYWAYAHFLGGIDGLPALPEEYEPYVGPANESGPPPASTNSADDKLRQAFGEECPELNDPIRLEVRSKGMVLAAREFRIVKEGDPDWKEHAGQVCLPQVSLALFSKDTGDGKFPEINTVRSDIAYLTFDQPITSPAEMGKHKIVGGELIGNVKIVNNRRTPERDDDLDVFTPGPVFYKEEDHHVWTDAVVELKDEQSKPDPQKVTGFGLDLYLAVEQPQQAPEQADPAGKHARGAPHKPKQDAITGVERIKLRHDVRMDLYVDSNSGFLGGPDDKDRAAKPGDKDKAAKPAPETPDGKPKEKSHVIIITQGPFVYDVPKAHAQFNVSDSPGPYANRVSVTRVHDEGKYDELDCEHLEIQFHPKEGAGAQPVREDRSVDLEIDWAHATGKEVILKSDVDMLEAYGNDFFYDAHTRQSTLKGDPEMWAVKEGNEIHAVELRLVQQQGAQQATAIGPGRIALLDKANGKRSQHARWKDKLVSSRDGAYDLLVLTEEAAFLDDEHQQQLAGDTLKVWLEPAQPQAGSAPAADQKPAAAPADGAADNHGRRPHHVIAEGHVVARSPDLNVHDTDRLTIYFRDDPQAAAALAAGQARDGDPPAGAAAPGTAAAPAPPGDHTPDKPDAPPAPAAPPGTPAEPAASTQATPAGESGKQARPMDLSARLVEAHVVRGENKNELERLWTEGGVTVHQEPASPGDKGVDIRGETLQLTRKPEGNYLVVTGGGERDDLANLLMDKILIIGPVVHIDQATNKAWVNGTGAMRMDSDTTFEGRKLKEPVPLTIHWDNSMFFDGHSAEFHGGPKGGVQAEQQNSRLLCRSMQTLFDRMISLKQNDKGAPPAKVRRLTCDQAVRVDDTELDEKGRLVKYQRIDCPELDVDNESGEVHAAGPGVVRILQRGSDDPVGPVGPGPGSKAPADPRKGPDDELKLTRVRYSGRMYANNKTHTAIFTDEVRAVHVPSQDADLEPNIDKLPEGGLYQEADRLKVWTRPEADGKASQMMEADGHCKFRSEDSYGRSEKISFDESKDQVVLETKDGLAEVYRVKVQGGPREELRAEKILYYRRTGAFQGINTKGVESH
jgi:hypothetical protein